MPPPLLRRTDSSTPDRAINACRRIKLRGDLRFNLPVVTQASLTSFLGLRGRGIAKQSRDYKPIDVTLFVLVAEPATHDFFFSSIVPTSCTSEGTRLP